MDPTSMDGYGYGADNLDNGFSKFAFPGQNQHSQPLQPQQSYPQQPQQPQQFYGQQQPLQQQQQQQTIYQPQTTQQGLNDAQTSQGASKKFVETFNSAFPNTKKDLLFAKSFYFFFFAAFGSLFPLIGIYFKQLGMSPLQTGFLIGLRPFVELFAGPFWGDLAERWKKWKTILLCSLSCWIIFTVSLAFVQPSANSCLIHNGSDIFVAKPYTISGLTFENMKPREVHTETRKKRSLFENIFGHHLKKQHKKKVSAHRMCQKKTPDAGIEPQNVNAIKTSQHRSITSCIRRQQTKEDVESQSRKNSSTLLAVENDKHSNIIIDKKVRLKRNAKKKSKTQTTTTTAAPEENEEEDETEDEEVEEEEEEEEADKNKDGDEKRDHDGKKKESVDNNNNNKDDEKATEHAKNKQSDNHKTKTTDKKKEVPPAAHGNEDDEDKGGDDDDDDYEYYEIDDDEPFDATKVESAHRFYQFKEFPYPAIDIPGLSPLPLNHEHIMNLEKEDVKDLVSPPLSAVVYRIQDVRNVFLILLILQILGEFLSTPSLTLADTATLGYLDDQTENYGKQRIYGSLGWAVSMFFVGIALDHSNVFSSHPCGTEHLVDRNYMTCYAVFGVFMFCALLSALKFRFKESDSPVQSVPLQQLKEKVFDKVHQKMGGKQGQEKIENGLIDAGMNQQETDRSNQATNEPPQSNPITYIPRGKPGQAGTMPHWVAVLKMFAPIQFSSMLFVLWFVGFGVGLVFAFLFWHLQDLGGTPTLFGIASVINHLSELGAFLFIKKLVAKIGHLNVVYAGLVANVIRFITISYLGSPWGVLPFELLQGLTHAAVWAAGVSYMTQAIPEENKPTAQMILQSLHLAVGRGCGTVIGGIFISSYGTQSVFRGYGITCLIVVIGYFALNFFFISKLPPIVGAPPMTNEFTDDSSYLTPHGVPGSTVSKSASSTRLDHGMEQQQPLQQQQYQQQQQQPPQQQQYSQQPQYPQQQQQQYPYVADNQVPPAYVSSYPQAPQRVSDGIYRPGHMATQWGQF